MPGYMDVFKGDVIQSPTKKCCSIHSTHISQHRPSSIYTTHNIDRVAYTACYASQTRRNTMQKVSLRKVKTPVSYLQDNSEEVLHFSLQGLLPSGHTLALNTTLGTLSHLTCKDDRPMMLMEQQFTTSEICVLL